MQHVWLHCNYQNNVSFAVRIDCIISFLFSSYIPLLNLFKDGDRKSKIYFLPCQKQSPCGISV